MGGHHSTQTSKMTTNIITNATLNATQNCLSYMDGTQIISIHGSGIIFKGNIQESQLSVDMKCVDNINQKGDFENKIIDHLTQELKDQEVALTQWLDSSGDDQHSDITTNVVTNITFNDVQNCLASLNGTQMFIVSGNNDVVVDNMQKQTLSLAQQCLMSGGQATEVVNDVTNTLNQHSSYVAQNPFAFITDAITAILKSAMATAAVIFIAIVILVLVFKIGTQRKSGTPVIVAGP